MSIGPANDQPHRHSAPGSDHRPFRILRQQRDRDPDSRFLDQQHPDASLPYYRGRVITGFSAIHAVPSPTRHGRPHGHDFTAEFVFEATDLVEPGVVVDDHLRDEITHHVATRLDERDLNVLLGRPATCEAIAGYLLDWYTRSAPLPIHAYLTTIAITTSTGGHGELHLPRPLRDRRPR